MLKINFLPREEKFYRFLEQLAAQGQASARYLKIYIESKDAAEKRRAGDAIIASKAEAKRISAEVTKQLCLTFVTPFDREDIQDFATDLYKITKIIEKIFERLSLHGIEDIGGDFSRQTELIVQEAAAMESVVKALVSNKGSDQILKEASKLQELENRGDAVLSELLVALFKDTKDARELILRKDVYDMLEKVIDRYRDAAGVALQIVLKHS